MRLNPTNTNIIKRLLVGRNSRPLKSILLKLPVADLASLFSLLNDLEKRRLLDALMSIDRASEALMELPEQQLAPLLKKIENNKLLALLKYSAEDHAAHFLDLLSEEQRTEFLALLDKPREQKLRQYLSYPEDSTGRIMRAEVFSLPMDLTATEGLEILRTKAQEQSIYYIYCVDHQKRLVGVLSLRRLATAPAATPLGELIDRDIITISPETPTTEAAQIVTRYGFVALPVVNQDQRLIGLITVDDIMEIIQDQVTANIYASAGLQESDRVYSSVRSSFRNRLPWMFLNLLLAGVASSVISLFEETMAQLIILASLKNIVAGMGGNTAIQSLTVVTRGLATDDFHFITTKKAVLKETLVGCLIGLVTGLGAALLVLIWKKDPLVSIVIFIAMFMNALLASAVGSSVPVMLKKLGRDPALGSGVLVTMMTDIFGFASFLGTATLGLYLLR